MVISLALDDKIIALVPEVTSALQTELQDALRTLRNGQNPVGVLLVMSRLSLRLMEEVFAGVGHKLPSDNLYDCIVTAARGDPQKRLTGLRFLPDEMASYLHTLRTLSNKVDHAAERVTLTVADAENALNMFIRVLEWFYCESQHGPQLSGIYLTPAALPLSPDREISLQISRETRWGRMLRGVQRCRQRTLWFPLHALALVGLACYVAFPYVYVLRADTLLQQARSEEDMKRAGEVYQTAAEQLRWWFWGAQRAVVLNRVGRIYAVRRFGGSARHFYNEALQQDPALAEAYANKAFLVEETAEQEAYLSAKTGTFDDALELYKQALEQDPDDHFTRALQEGVPRRRQMALHRAKVAELLSAGPQKCREAQNTEDDWTSPPLTLALHTTGQRQEGFSSRAGEGEVLVQRLVQQLRESQQVVVQESAIEDGCLAVPLLVHYSVLHSPSERMHKGVLQMQVLETATARRQAEEKIEWTYGQLDGIAEQLASTLLQRLHPVFPLRARITSITPQETVVLNIGTDHGVSARLTMQVLGLDGPAGVLEVTQVEKQQSRARVVAKTTTVGLQKNWKVQEVQKP